MIKTSWITNPFYIYIISFTIVFFVYSLGWSSAFPPISFSVKIFFGITFFFSMIMAPVVSNHNKRIIFRIPESSFNKKALYFITIGYIAEFIYNKGIPLYLIIATGENYNLTFGIPTFHVILCTFSSFYGIYFFHQYLSSKKKKNLYSFCYIQLFSILIIARISVMFVFVTVLFVYLLSIKRLKLKFLLIISLLILFIFFGFGYLGNLRSSIKDNTYMPRMSKATTQFLNSSIPNEYFWGYAYIASPLGNFQHNINTYSPQPSIHNLFCLIKTDLILDFISKRLFSNDCTVSPNRHVDHFNVATIYTLSLIHI